LWEHFGGVNHIRQIAEAVAIIMHNILQAQASRPFSTMQNTIQQHPRSTATLDSHDL
jgi:hypothetical protein